MAVVEAPKPSEESNTKTSQPNTITLRIARSNPAAEQESSFSEFQIPVQKWTTVL